MNYLLEFSPGNALSKDVIAACISVIKEGGAVNSESAAKELPKAKIVVIVRDGQDIVGVGAIKERRPEYASKIAKRSGFTFDKNTPELGYVARKKSHRGHRLSEQIVAKLLAALSGIPLFATTSNETMKIALKEAGFAKQGNEWPGTNNNELSLWIKEGESK
ncbi:MAG TPA: hypothetical protein VGT24_07055 [Candidatus Acidoferrales bacterium]|nr:hypothetical protein [Candidatus Acidoferrales bacterium]